MLKVLLAASEQKNKELTQHNSALMRMVQMQSITLGIQAQDLYAHTKNDGDKDARHAEERMQIQDQIEQMVTVFTQSMKEVVAKFADLQTKGTVTVATAETQVQGTNTLAPPFEVWVEEPKCWYIEPVSLLWQLLCPWFEHQQIWPPILSLIQ